jgi:hypothetical protein
MLGNTSLTLNRDLNGYPLTTLSGLPFSIINQYFTLTAMDVTTVTVPESNAHSYTAFFTYTPGADVWVLPASTPTLTAPNGTVTSTLAQLCPGARTVVPGQTLQLLYNNTVYAESVVSVGIAYYANNY